MRIAIVNLVVATSLIAATSAAMGARLAEGAEGNVGEGRLGLKGYDPVSYFTGQPAVGRPELTAEYQGIVYRFATEENRNKFRDTPAQFAPAYGGWCATAMAKDGSKVDIDPKSYKVTDGRLYLFYKSFWSSAIDDWIKDEARNIVKADQAWKALQRK